MSRVPRIIARHSLAALTLTPIEAFLVARIDAVTPEEELGFMAGLGPDQVASLLDRLLGVAAIDFVGAHPAAAAPPPPAPTVSEIDLDPSKQRRIDGLMARLDEATYYELLGITEAADKKQVKSAYYALAPEFHPDKFFRKNLGPYKAKIEALFARFTMAHDVLSTPERRAEYDDYLAQAAKNKAASATLEQTQHDLAAMEAVMREASARAQAAARPASMPPPAQGSRPQDPRASAPSTQVSADEALRLRREALARKLTAGGRRTGPTRPDVTPPMRPADINPEIAARAAEMLRQRHEAAIAEAKRQNLQRYLDAGRNGLAAKDYAAAANAFRIALSLDPENAQLQATCGEAMKQTAAALADGYWKQANYEEGQERFAEAALSYAKVCDGRPNDALAHERVAYATLRSSTNSRRAVEFARRAVELMPKSPDFRITLARAYAAAGLEKSRDGELERALELGAGHARIKTLVAQVRAVSTKDTKVS